METIKLYIYAFVVLLFALPTVVAQVPTLLAPADGATNVSLTDSINWSGTGNYQYQVDKTSAAFSDVIVAGNNYALTSFTFTTELSYARTYYWHVLKSTAPASAWSPTWSFTTINWPAFTGQIPVNAASTVPLNQTFSWNAIPDVSSYQIIVASDPGFVTTISNIAGIVGTSTTVAGLSNYTTYYWRLYATDLGGGVSPASTTLSFTTVPSAVPSAFTLISPADGSLSFTIAPTANFTWNASTEVDQYSVEVSLAADNFTPVSFSTVSTSPLASISGLNFSTDYLWRVKATNSLGTTTSSVFSFTSAVKPPPSKPTLNSPAGDEVVPELPTLVWNPSTPSSPDLTYSLQVTQDPTFYVIPVATNISGIVGNSYIVGANLDRGSPYYWRVKATNSSGSSLWSTPQKFIVSLSGMVEPPVPVLTNPSDASTIHGWDVGLAWYSNYFGDELTYVLEYGTDNSFIVTTSVPIGLGVTNYSLAGLAPSTTFYWRVKAIKGIIESAFSVSNSFTTPPLVAATVPVASWPIGGTEIYNTAPTLYWYLNSNSVGLNFDLQYNLVDNTFDGDEVTVPGLATSNYTLPALAPGQVVYWQVRSNNGAQQSLYLTMESFSVANTASVPVTPTISWPKSGATVYSTVTDLNWYVNGNSTGLYYEVQFRTATIADNIVDYTTVPNVFTQTINPLSWATTYYWRVRSVDGINPPSVWSAEASFSTFGTAGANVPIQSWPLNGITTYTTTQQLSWYLNGSSAGYTYDVEVNGSVVATGLTANSYDYTPLVPGETYTWRVRSNVGPSQSSWSSLLTFYAYTGYGSIAPRLGSPVNGISLTTSSPELSWFVNTPTNSLKYEIQISDNIVFLEPTIVNDLTSLSFKANELSSNKTYYWRVRSKDKDGHFSNFSSTEVFAVSNLTGVADANGKIPTAFSIEQNYPNPFNPTTIINYGIPQNAEVTISIYNMLGQKVKTLVSEQKNAGAYSVQWNGDNEFGQKVASGPYIYKINAGNFIKSMKLLLLK